MYYLRIILGAWLDYLDEREERLDKITRRANIR